MWKGSISGYPPVAKLLILVGIFLLVAAAAEYISFVITDLLFPGISITDLLTRLSATGTASFSTRETDALKCMQIISSLIRFPGTAAAFLYLDGKSFFPFLQLNKRVSAQSVLLIILIMLSAINLIGVVEYWNELLPLPRVFRTLEDRALTQTDAFLQVSSIWGLLFNLLSIAILPAITEEILFRGLLQKFFAGWTKNPHWGIWIAAALFSAIHLQFFGFFPRMLLGALLGYLFYFSGSLWSAIWAHCINNAFAVIAYYIAGPEAMNGSSGVGDPWLIAISIPLFAVLMYLFLRSVKKQGTSYG